MWRSAAQGEAWRALLAGHEIALQQQEQEKQRLMLERFQEEASAPACSKPTLVRCSCIDSYCGIYAAAPGL